jgi:hypothetical protein
MSLCHLQPAEGWDERESAKTQSLACRLLLEKVEPCSRLGETTEFSRSFDNALAFSAANDENNGMSRKFWYYFWFTFTRLGCGTGGCA